MHQGSLEKYEEDLNAARKQLEERDESLLHHEQLSASKTEEISSLKSLVEELNMKIDRYCEDLKMSDNHLCEEVDKKLSLKQEVTQLQGQVDGLRDDLESTSKRLEEEASLNIQKTTELDQLKKMNKDLQKQIKTMASGENEMMNRTFSLTHLAQI